MHKLSFQPGTSLIHRLYPLTKLAWLLLGSVFVFILSDGILLMILAGLSLLVLTMVESSIWQVRGFRFSFTTGFILFVLYLLFDKSGIVLINPGIDLLRVTSGGLETGLRFSGRFLSIIFLSYIFILTTEPSDLAYALMKLGLPYRFGFMLVTALRLAPLMEEEGRTIYQAQLVRGIRYDRGGPKRLLLLIRQFMTPLLISALSRADKLVFSMEGRGFGRFPIRSFRKRTSPSNLDIIINLLLVCISAIFLYMNFGGLAQ